MGSRLEIEEILRAELDFAKSRHESTRAEFARVCNDIPSGLPHPDGTQRILNASRAQASAQAAYAAALKRFNDFILTGKIPDHLAAEKRSGA